MRISSLASRIVMLAVVGAVLASANSPSTFQSSHRAATRGVWPVLPATILQGFHPPSVRWGAGHRGLDLASSPGQSVMAPVGGVVLFAAPLAGRGVLVLRHGALRSTYEPVSALVTVGSRVERGQHIATVSTGSGHCGSGACLHWGLLRGSIYLDPRILIGLHPILKPP